MLRFGEGVSTSLGLNSAAGADPLPKGDLVRFCVGFRVTCLVKRGTLGTDSTAPGVGDAENKAQVSKW